MSLKARRQTHIRDLIARQHPRSQEEIASRLEQAGIGATQATLSRDLRELGVVKGSGGYRLPGPGNAEEGPSKDLDRALQAYLLSARCAGSLVVLRTGPGQASALALEVDRAGLDGAVGTVAGDDTIFVAAQSGAKAARLAKALEGMASGTSSA